METIDEIMKRKLKEAQNDVLAAERDLQQAVSQGREKVARAEGKVELLTHLCEIAWDGYAERQRTSPKRRTE